MGDTNASSSLRELLVRHFSEDELDGLCFDLTGDHEVVPGRGKGKGARALEIVAYFGHREELARVVAWCVEHRPGQANAFRAALPGMTWPSLTATPNAAPTPPAGSRASNPFHPRGRINDPAQFFGRERLVREVRGELLKMSSVSVIGEPEIGKSSLLYYLYATRAEWFPEGDLHYVDLQRALDQADFCGMILSALGEGGDSPRQLKRAIEARIGLGRNVVLLLDELERLADKDIDPRLLDLLRSLAQERHFALGVATRRPVSLVFPTQEGVEPRLSEFHNIFTQKSLGPFSDAEARDCVLRRLVGTGVAFSAAELVQLIAESRGHPARLQVAAKALYDAHG